MTDISICMGEACDKKEKCYRWIEYHRHHLNLQWQPMVSKFPSEGDCGHFLSKEENNLTGL